jgi:uncharacterized membrane protein
MYLIDTLTRHNLRRRRRLRVYIYKTLRPHVFRPRLSVVAVLGLGFYLVSEYFFEPLRAALIAFDAASLMVIAACTVIAAKTSARMMPRRAGEENERKFSVLVTGVVVSVVILGALGLELTGVKQKSVNEVVLSSATIVLAWGFLNMLFAFHYAHEFYRWQKRKVRPVSFPGTTKPDYFDFVYFAFTIGMTFQVTDVEVRSGPIRHAVFVHALISFFLSVIVLALMVNVFVGVLYSG